MSGNRLTWKRGLASGLSVLAVALVSGAAAGTGGQEQIKFNPADQAAAKAVIIRRSDLGPGSWTGGPTKPDLSPLPTCPGYAPKQSDLVLTGAAQAIWKKALSAQDAGVEFDIQVGVLQTAKMVQLDWKRTVLAPGAVSCMSHAIATSFKPAKLTSFKRIAVAQIAQDTVELQGAFAVVVQGQTLRGVVDELLIGKGRTEITLATVALLSTPAATSAIALSLARRLIARAKA